MKTMLETDTEQLKTSAETKRRICDFLKTHPTGVLSTTDEDGGPRATVIYFATTDDFTITFVTKQETKKHQNLQLDARAMLVAYEASSQTTVQIEGVASLLDDPNDTKLAIEETVRISIETSESGEPAIDKLEAGNYVAYQLLPHQIRMAVFARPDPGGYDIYETIYFQK